MKLAFKTCKKESSSKTIRSSLGTSDENEEEFRFRGFLLSLLVD
jgi:hypothetical protein